MNQWILLRRGADYQAIAEKYRIDQVIARIIRNRGIETEEELEMYLHGGKECFGDPMLLKDMDRACKILAYKISDCKKIRVIGDYDIDGICATAILLKGLRFLGAEADAVIPHRIKDGYGLNRDLIQNAADEGIDTVITCDNGIAAKEEIALANELGMTVIITDHHEVPFEEKDGKKEWILPPAAAVVDPKQEDCGYPFSGICGAFVAFKLIHAMVDGRYAERLKTGDGWKGRWEELDKELLQLAAFATIGDIIELTGENRALVRTGTTLMTNEPCRGLKALIDAVDLSGAVVTSYHIGFILGPCMNATGRLDTAARALELLMTEDEEEAVRLAGELKSLNDSRKEYTDQGVNAAVCQVEQGEHDGCSVYVIYLPECHESIAGIVAGRIRERYHRPALVVTDAEDGLKGSGRSTENYHMYQQLSAVKDVFTKFGGHAQAAGFSLPRERLEELRIRLNENSPLTEEDCGETIYIDADMPFSYVTEGLMDQFRLLEPTGNGNKKPLFARKDLILLSAKFFGNEGKVGKYRVRDTDGHIAELTMFRMNGEFKQYLVEKYGENTVQDAFAGKCESVLFSVVYHPQWNEYNGQKSIQYIVNDYH